MKILQNDDENVAVHVIQRRWLRRRKSRGVEEGDVPAPDLVVVCHDLPCRRSDGASRVDRDWLIAGQKAVESHDRLVLVASRSYRMTLVYVRGSNCATGGGGKHPNT